MHWQVQVLEQRHSATVQKSSKTVRALLKSNMLQTLVRNQSALMVQYAVMALLPLVLVPFVVRTIGLERFGTLSIMLAFANYAALVVQYGFRLQAPPLIVQADTHEQRIQIVQELLSARLVLAGGVLIVLWAVILVLPVLGYPLTFAQKVMLLSLPVGTFFNLTWYLQAIQRFFSIAVSAVLAVAGALVAAFLLLGRGLPDETGWLTLDLAAAIVLSAGPVLTGICSGGAALIFFYRSGGRFKLRNPKTALVQGWPFFASHLIAGLYGGSGVLIIGALAGAAQAGAFSALERLIMALGNACLLIHTAAYPRLSSTFKTDPAKFRQLQKIVLSIYWMSAFAITCFVALFWNDTQSYIFGDVGPSFSWLLAGGQSLLITMVFGTIYTGKLAIAGRNKELLPLTLRLLVFTFVVGIPLVIAFGAFGWFITLSASHLVVGVLFLNEWKKERDLT